MKQYLIIAVLIVSVFLIGCSHNSNYDNTIEDDMDADYDSNGLITDFYDCVAAGNPIMESYPRQCNADGETFVEDIKPEEAIGGQKDEHGCLGPAGYSWNDNIFACIREWELNDTQRKASKTAIEQFASEDGLTVVQVTQKECDGCFVIEISDSEFNHMNVTLENWEVLIKE